MDGRPAPAAVAGPPHTCVLGLPIDPHEREERQLVAEVGQDEPRWLERPVAVRKGDVHAGIAETDDVRPPDTAQVGEEARMHVDAPAAGFVAEVADDGHRLEAERPVAVAVGDVDARVAEADDVGATVASHVREEAWVFVDAPAACFVAEVADDRHGLER